ncbi:PadR family transcriptional regulator [Paenibacillus sp. MMS20-IR301]|uniref:PadR family transcriptional regulator n=1 Tax=Paenibacillus sp. MMS20-IR301 TaxID=2895946 RepID=UPI0028E4F801|nr:PadR family transcriptional regulator [Paenibacillus sp. MMS20-IR301]WNS44557.1 PadR family transcriptional regulator [Paenibacillus sp. MMS20-IR301]
MAFNQSLQMEQLSDSAYYILLALLTPKHGYAIMKYIEELTEGEVKMGPATLYTLIKKLQKAGSILLNEDEDDRRKTYQITASGTALVEAEIERRLRMSKHGSIAQMKAREEN